MSLRRGNTALRLASVALAAGLWFVIAGRQTAERGVTVPVEVRNVPRDLETTGDAPNTVDAGSGPRPASSTAWTPESSWPRSTSPAPPKGRGSYSSPRG